MELKSIIGFYHTFKVACDNGQVHKSVPIWLVLFFKLDTEAAVATRSLSLKDRPSCGTIRKDILALFAFAVNDLLKTCANDEIIAKPDMEVGLPS